jgi:hypothetical protein
MLQIGVWRTRSSRWIHLCNERLSQLFATEERRAHKAVTDEADRAVYRKPLPQWLMSVRSRRTPARDRRKHAGRESIYGTCRGRVKRCSGLSARLGRAHRLANSDYAAC